MNLNATGEIIRYQLREYSDDVFHQFPNLYEINTSPPVPVVAI